MCMDLEHGSNDPRAYNMTISDIKFAVIMIAQYKQQDMILFSRPGHSFGLCLRGMQIVIYDTYAFWDSGTLRLAS